MFPIGKTFRISYSIPVGKARLSCLNERDLEEIRECYSEENKNAYFIQLHGYNVERRHYVINQFGYFPIGFTLEILRYIKLKFGSLSQVAMSDGFRRLMDERIVPLKKQFGCLSKDDLEILCVSDDSGMNERRVSEGKTPYGFRSYQECAIRSLLFGGWGRGIIEVGTSGGKTFILGNLIYNIWKQVNANAKVLVLVPNKQLVYQMRNDFVEYGFPDDCMTLFTRLTKGDKPYDANRNLIIANRQYVFTNIDRLPPIDVLICDEVHTAIAERTRNCINTLDPILRFGCTGSVPRGRFERWSLMSEFGNVVYSKPVGELQRDGFVSKMKLIQISVVDSNVEGNRDLLFHVNAKHKYNPDENGYSEIPFNAAHNAEHDYCEKYYRDLYKPVLEYIGKFDSNTLLLFGRIEMGKNLTELARELLPDRKVHYIDGSVPVKDRLEITNCMENSERNVLFAEFATFSTGISVKNLTNLVFVGDTKSLVRCLQSIGRTLRLHKDKDYARIIDVSFKDFKYSQRHLRERLMIYRDHYGKEPDEKLFFRI
jgi:superfamily II DNA or RNA helicase